MRVLLVTLVAALPVAAQVHLQSFEKVWTTVRDTHWQKQPGGLDWQAIHDEFRPRIEGATSIEETRAILQQMLARLKQTHFGIVPGTIYSKLGDVTGDAAPGLDLRVLGPANNRQAIVVSVDEASPAQLAGVKPGWILESARGESLSDVIAAGSQLNELQLTRAVLARLTGPTGATVPAVFRDARNDRIALELGLTRPRGIIAQFGNLPPTPVFYEEKQFGIAAYAHFNMFLDIPRLMPAFERTIKSCAAPCRGLIIDLRGNPGGIGGMAMGMAGFLIDKPGLRLGTMYMRDATLNFVINPRPEVFAGPVAILVDGASASTSEILAGGLQDLGRARIFGTRTAAAALPSLFERLPNGDGFQYAIANYVSADGEPLEKLGVTPDQEVRLTREALLDGRDPVLDAAVTWIKEYK